MLVETEEGAYLNKLVIPNVRMEDAGVYVCLGYNQGGGSDIREALLTVIKPTGNSLIMYISLAKPLVKFPESLLADDSTTDKLFHLQPLVIQG